MQRWKEKRWRIYAWTHDGGLQAGEPRPPTPWLKSIGKAAKIANMKPAGVRFKIQHYAKRNALAHAEVKNHINSADFDALAPQIIKDKQNLVKIYGNNPGRQVGYRLASGRVEEEWFDRPCYIGKDGRVCYTLSDKAIKKQKAVHANLRKSIILESGPGVLWYFGFLGFCRISSGD